MKKKTILLAALSLLLVACGQGKQDDRYKVTLVEFSYISGSRYKETSAYLSDELIKQSKEIYDYLVGLDVEKIDMDYVDGWEGADEYQCQMDDVILYIPTSSEITSVLYATDVNDSNTYHAWCVSSVPSEKTDDINSLRTQYKKLVTSKNAVVSYW